MSYDLQRFTGSVMIVLSVAAIVLIGASHSPLSGEALPNFIGPVAMLVAGWIIAARAGC